jgi:lysophospholipase L1-like esterase
MPALVLQAVAARAVFYPAVAASLLVFPAWLDLMILGWLAGFVAQVARGKAGWPPLAIVALLVLVKRVDWPPALLALAAVVAAVIALDRRRPRHFLAASTAALAIAWTVYAVDRHAAAHASARAALAPERPIVCLGDSITAWGFPRVLDQRMSVRVVDHAKGGITTGEALPRVEAMIAMRPQAVVLELGGHDFLRGLPRAEARRNLESIIRACRDAGAHVILFEIPRGFVMDAYAGLERELAREHDLELIEDGAIRQLVLFNPSSPLGAWTGRLLSDDGLHPNAAGHEFLADRVERALRRVLR